MRLTNPHIVESQRQNRDRQHHQGNAKQMNGEQLAYSRRPARQSVVQAQNVH